VNQALEERLPYLGVSALVVLLDQVTKRIIDQTMTLYQSIDVVTGVFSLTYVRNRGAAFGILSAADLPYQATLFSIVSLIALAAIVYYALNMPASDRLPQIALALIAGGAIGNLIDRVWLGYVIDFLDFYWEAHHWPMFNIADSCISTGVGLLIVDMLVSPSEDPETGIGATPAAEAD